MLKKLIEAVIGSRSERALKKIQPLVEQINALEDGLSKLSDDALRLKTAEFKERLARGETEDDILCEAFACVREASKRALKLRPYDVQLIGAIVLHRGKISEMLTGEGKTLVATLPAYLNALSGKGVHVITVNDYLARRDSQWMGPVHEFLGLTVGFILHDMTNEERRKMYNCDITYVTNNEIGFDYLRDNMVLDKSERVMRARNYAVVDEVDSILVDEARTPLIISGPAEESTDKYYIVNRVIPLLTPRFITEKEEINAKRDGTDLGKGYDALVDEKSHNVTLTEEGVAKAEKILSVGNIYDDVGSEWAHHLTQGLRAHHLFKKDVEYVVKDGEIIIVDEFTGRLMPGRRWSDGLHQAIEAKENLRIKEENQTLATITFQNYFKLYSKLSGMTGTAMTEADEFWEIYKLDVVEIPPNRPCVRGDCADRIYRTEREKNNAVVMEIDERWRKGQPMLVGTRSIEKSEKLAGMLRAKGIPHQVLNAKYHEMEAQIISEAGRKGQVTIATNMAGRGTDIVLGGTPAEEEKQKFVASLGGLHVMGTERHESRRIDNQLRGRCARQGDPGSSVFYVSLEDELMRLFGSERISSIMEKLGMQEGEVIESMLVSHQIEGAQRRVESMNFDSRKQLLDYDNVMNKQRLAVYQLRNLVLDGLDVTERVTSMIKESAEEQLYLNAAEGQAAALWNMEALNVYLKKTFGFSLEYTEDELRGLTRPAAQEDIEKRALEAYKRRTGEFAQRGVDFGEMQRVLLLQIIDHIWKNHLYDLDHLKKGVGLRAYGQKDPLIEYQKESYSLFETMLARVRDQMVEYIFRIQLPPRAAPKPPADRQQVQSGAQTQAAAEKKPQNKFVNSKMGRNDPCPCGSGKKYKKCHGT
ncbi:MAG: preprotein translocase subunit SecA [Elusimicrobia bacterium GWC2_51_8]|nr:MAG: preprotein translocase subunit SecA [Elusimicrobia bacterium GWA2_51_34]OGR58153.1 MAG: preprotein translocase subunit SecA [Elusimicrobia bacterium GWC2_51_8]OGR86430.1 MAG: preprotein translocase subunit SecA [Elusimicrobia bacterium GWF2_52_66]HAF96150.1 preprotein translocase subunit SecA [Elusimicrobiota bacterium]HCE97760.1 preprotein translocase subunit SecA [Elusimicrobiota bacterium]